MSRKSTLEINSDLYESIHGSPESNVAKVIEMMGGITSLIDQEDIIIIKPNAQWEGHATTNTNTIKGFIDLVLGIKNFKGEIIVAENHHYLPHDSRGWTTTNRNGDFNLNELISYYKNRDIENVTKYHWCDGGPDRCPAPGKAYDAGLINGPEDKDGYLWSADDYQYNGLKAKMSYPIFTSPYSGRKIDFKDGLWEKGSFSNEPIKFINMSGLNHHGNSGMTASIKNYLGVIDMTCGFSGDDPEDYYNFHYVGFNWPGSSLLRGMLKKLIKSRIPRKMKYTRKAVDFIGPVTGAMGGAVGCFMRTIRKADLNIIAAEYVGHESRWNNPMRLRAVLGSKDPVALDYYASKYILLPLGGSKRLLHDPDNPRNTLHKTLMECHKEGIGDIKERRMILRKFDFNDESLAEKRLHQISD